ncbi:MULTISPECIES: TauD/TfdA family dioxygenase [unclassified Erwinia]|uniref:TauD/TfdA family dioxygenase n=1 Tax=unclassified Erwinia TaxID=2622719 RepID=UPI001303FFEE|nr:MULTISPECIES: TauD/TfdA family dioxygenase [unclassified Erwinia]
MSIINNLETNGYAILNSYKPEVPSLEVCSALGEVDIVEGLNSVQTLIPSSLSDAPPNTYSGNFGTSTFPLHTDLAHWAVPPRYLVLRCLNGSEDVATHIYDSLLLIKKFGVQTLRMVLVQPRRPVRNEKQLMTLLEATESSDFFRVRWDSIYLKPATDLSKELFDRVNYFLHEIKPLKLTLLERGDTLIIDNWRCLHGRASIPKSGSMRHIDRVYLKALNESPRV